jgi:hypothetical protein
MVLIFARWFGDLVGEVSRLSSITSKMLIEESLGKAGGRGGCALTGAMPPG